MKEKISIGPSPEQIQRQEDEARLQAFLEKHPEFMVEEQIDSQAELLKAESLINEFEGNFDLSALHAISTEAEAKESELRSRAKDALGPIWTVVRPLVADESELPVEDKAKLKAQYQVISRAVGIINSGKLRHD